MMKLVLIAFYISRRTPVRSIVVKKQEKLKRSLNEHLVGYVSDSLHDKFWKWKHDIVVDFQ